MLYFVWQISYNANHINNNKIGKLELLKKMLFSNYASLLYRIEYFCTLKFKKIHTRKVNQGYILMKVLIPTHVIL